MRLLLLLSLLLATALPAYEVVKTDGEVIKGKLLQRIEGQGVRIRTADGKERLFFWDELKSLDGVRLGPPLPPPVTAATPAVALGEAKHFMDQSWLAFLAIGLGTTSNPPAMDSALTGATKQACVALEVLGFYWPLKDKRTALGFVISGLGDAYSVPRGSGTDTLQVNHYTYGLSAWHSLKGELGDGPFARLDLGPARLAMDLPGGSVVFSDWGWGAVLGLGWLIGEGPEHRFTVSALYSPRFINGDPYQTGSVEGGFLW